MLGKFEAEAFERFVRENQAMAYSLAFRLVGNAAEAQDIAQNAFVQAYRNFRILKNNPAASGWLRTTVRHLSLNYLNRYRSRWMFFSEASEEDYDPADPVESALFARTDQQAALERALSRLPDCQRVPVVLFYFEGLAYEVIARQLGVPLSKVKTDIFRAKQKLRKILEQ